MRAVIFFEEKNDCSKFVFKFDN